MPDFQFRNFFKAKNFMNHTGSIPQHHFPACFLNQVGPKIFIGCKNDLLVFRQTFDDIGGIAAGADDITQRFDSGRAIDIGNHDMIRMFFFKFFK